MIQQPPLTNRDAFMMGFNMCRKILMNLMRDYSVDGFLEKADAVKEAKHQIEDAVEQHFNDLP